MAVALCLCVILLVAPLVLLRTNRSAVSLGLATSRTPTGHGAAAGPGSRSRPPGVSFLAWIDSAAPAAVLVSGSIPPPSRLPKEGTAPAGPAGQSSTGPADPVAEVTTTTAPRTHSEVGPASWYAIRPGTCAHPYLPFGTDVLVTNLDNGRQAHCVVDDRGPYVPGRIIDLSKAVFAELASTRSGLIEVRLNW